MSASAQISMDVIGILSIWCEVLLYGLYCTLFIESVYVIIKKRRITTFSAKIYFTATVVMFGLASAHIAINLYRLLRGYVWLAADPGPVIYFAELGRWENLAHDAMSAVMLWIGDALIIYRCFLIWDRNFYIIILPTILLCASIVTNGIALHLFPEARLRALFSPILSHWISTIYALVIAQNTVTTGLIAYRIWRQEQASKAFGLRSVGTAMSLIPLMRIVVESAAIYVLTAILLLVLYARDNDFQYVVQEAINPIAGIVFTLITVRLALRNSKSLARTIYNNGTPVDWEAQASRNAETVDPETDKMSSTAGTMNITLKSMESLSPTDSLNDDLSSSGTGGDSE